MVEPVVAAQAVPGPQATPVAAEARAMAEAATAPPEQRIRTMAATTITGTAGVMTPLASQTPKKIDLTRILKPALAATTIGTIKVISPMETGGPKNTNSASKPEWSNIEAT